MPVCREEAQRGLSWDFKDLMGWQDLSEVGSHEWAIPGLWA